MLIREEIRNGRILLRCLSEEDISQDYLSWLNDEEVNQFLEVRFSAPSSLDELARYVDSINNSDTELLLGIFLVDEAGRHIGNIKLGPINFTHSRADIGILIGEKAFWGKGLATEAVALLSRYGLTELGLTRLYAGCYESNTGSRKAFEKAGFVLDARLEDYWETPDGLGENELILKMKKVG